MFKLFKEKSYITKFFIGGKLQDISLTKLTSTMLSKFFKYEKILDDALNHNPKEALFLIEEIFNKKKLIKFRFLKIWTLQLFSSILDFISSFFYFAFLFITLVVSIKIVLTIDEINFYDKTNYHNVWLIVSLYFISLGIAIASKVVQSLNPIENFFITNILTEISENLSYQSTINTSGVADSDVGQHYDMNDFKEKIFFNIPEPHQFTDEEISLIKNNIKTSLGDLYSLFSANIMHSSLIYAFGSIPIVLRPRIYSVIFDLLTFVYVRVNLQKIIDTRLIFNNPQRWDVSGGFRYGSSPIYDRCNFLSTRHSLHFKSARKILFIASLPEDSVAIKDTSYQEFSALTALKDLSMEPKITVLSDLGIGTHADLIFTISHNEFSLLLLSTKLNSSELTFDINNVKDSNSAPKSSLDIDIDYVDRKNFVESAIRCIQRIK